MDYELKHHGILGMKWGIRRYQNEDGSLTAAGRDRYGSGGGKVVVKRDVVNTKGVSVADRGGPSRNDNNYFAKNKLDNMNENQNGNETDKTDKKKTIAKVAGVAAISAAVIGAGVFAYKYNTDKDFKTYTDIVTTGVSKMAKGTGKALNDWVKEKVNGEIENDYEKIVRNASDYSVGEVGKAVKEAEIRSRAAKWVKDNPTKYDKAINTIKEQGTEIAKGVGKGIATAAAAKIGLDISKDAFAKKAIESGNADILTNEQLNAYNNRRDAIERANKSVSGDKSKNDTVTDYKKILSEPEKYSDNELQAALNRMQNEERARKYSSGSGA